MYQCSNCTAGSSFCSLDPSQKCIKCGVYAPHLCGKCFFRASGVMPTTCHMCTDREHICLSKCLGGCYLKETHVCGCGLNPVRLRVNKSGKNHGRYFYSCRSCGYFEWD